MLDGEMAGWQCLCWLARQLVAGWRDGWLAVPLLAGEIAGCWMARFGGDFHMAAAAWEQGPEDVAGHVLRDLLRGGKGGTLKPARLRSA